ncbi:RIMS-binding protein 2-like protein [Euroglyphus maynei]|uniref:RIMS-binding protein 2-like protein n=1 Tax=Euroglyphus maynei TaxID=6958 RepID=A0A1Y3B2Y5_EURMA|nr:RIMS-binding protein 2-like protein [Euroglyphus maynei]
MNIVFKMLKRIEDKLASMVNRSTSISGQHKQQQQHLSNDDNVVDKSRKNLDGTKVQQSSSLLNRTKMDIKFSTDDNHKKSNVSSKDLDLLMEKLDRDNKILAELDRKLKTVHCEESGQSLLSSSLPSYATTAMPKTNILNDQHHIISKSSNPLTNNNRIGQQRMLPMAESSYSAQIDELKEAEEIVDSIELPNRGRCKVFMAKYNYDPYKHSPNDNPETEVTLLAGDFILIFGNIDEDGYYYGELLDGRRGLVPSNFIEKLTGDDLFEFQARVLYGHNNKDAESDTASFPPEFYDAILSEQIGHTSFQHLLAPVPPPQRLIVERQLHKSVLIGWLHPECPRTMIDHYQIYVDGVHKATIPAGDRTKALVEGVDSSMRK